MKKPLFDANGRLNPSFDYRQVLEAVDKVVTAAGRDGVARGIGYSYEQLRRITNPEPDPDEVRHLRLDKFMEIAEATGDLRGVEALNLAFGLRPVPIAPLGESISGCDDLMLVVLQTGADAGRLAQLAHEAAADGHLSQDERKLLRARILENIRFLSAAALALGEPAEWNRNLAPDAGVEKKQ